MVGCHGKASDTRFSGWCSWTGGETILLATGAGQTAAVKSMGTNGSHINPYAKFVTGRGLHNQYPWYALLDVDYMSYYWGEDLELSSLKNAKETLLGD